MKKYLLVSFLLLIATVAFSDGRNYIASKMLPMPEKRVVYHVETLITPLSDTTMMDDSTMFIKQRFDTTYLKVQNLDQVELGLNGAASPVQGIDLTNILLGITDFTIERSKMELNIAFFSRFQKFLDQNSECKILFPNTLQALQRMQSFQFNEFLPNLRSGFFGDLKNFPDKIGLAISLPRYVKLFQSFPEIPAAINVLSIVSKLKTKDQHLNDIILQLSQIPDCKCDKTKHRFLYNFEATLKLVNVISTACVDPASGTYYKKADLQKLLENPDKLQGLYEAIVDQCKNEEIAFYDNTGKEFFIADALGKLNVNVVFKGYMQSVVNAVNDFELAKNNASQIIKSTTTTAANKQQVALDYLNAAVQSIDIIGNIFNLMDVVNAEPYLNLTRNAAQITRDAISQDYPSLVSNSLGFLETIFTMADASGNPDKAKSRAIQTSLNVLSQFVKYANFAANVVSAKSSKEVTSAIENAALPPGSSAIKKNSNFNLSLQIHLGGAVTAKSYANSTTLPSWKNAFSVTLPVGVSANYGFGKGGCLGVFASIIDIGALAQFRLSSSDTTSLTERIRFSNILSPGVFLSYGFGGNLPLSLNFGGQFGPGLTSASVNGNIIEQPSWRLLASLTVDIPAFTIFNISKKKTNTVDIKQYDFKKP
jgi:hypothetical protein